MGKKRIKLTDENKSWGLTALIVICLSILFYLIMTRIPALKVGLGEIISVMLPFILGIVMAYLLLPIYNGINVRLRALLSKKMKEKTARRLASGISVIVSMLLLLTVVFGFVIIVVPQILKSVITISTMIPAKWDLLIEKVNALLKNNPQLMRYARQVLENAESMLNEVITDKLLPNFSNALTTVTTKIINAAGFLFDLIIGMIVCIYMLLGKERLSAQAKKIVYSRMSTKTANNLIADARRVHGIFAGYISGNLLDSLIVGLLCFIVLPFLNMPYVLLISVIVGVTNIIPFFGPFIGAIPSILLVLMDGSLKKAIILTVFIFILQQLDGNVIKPRALGNTTGLPSFWVLFSILVGGGLFGFAGLLFAVPVFATIYMFVSRNAERNLRKRRLPYETDDFIGVPALDPVTHQPVYDDSFMDDENTDSEEYQHEEDQSSDAVARSGSDRREMKSTDDCKDEAADASLGDTKSNDDKYNGSSSIRNKERNGENASHGDSRANASDGRIADAEEQSLNAKFKKYAALLGKAAYKKMKGVSSELKNRKSESHENKNGDAKHSKAENREK